jgi:hypothetical protein
VVWTRTPFFWVMMLHHTIVAESTHCSKTNSNFHTQASNDKIKYVITAIIRTPQTLHTYFPRNKCLYKINAKTKICQYSMSRFARRILKSSSTTTPPKCYAVARVTGSDLGFLSFRHIGICHFVLYHSHGFRSVHVQVRH